VIQTKGAVYGLTTGATIWMVAAVGMAVATDLYMLGIATTVLTTGVLVLLAPLSSWLSAKAESRREKQPAAAKEPTREKEED
jgi:putative Mg2+ transporter-C (MgtC) family protein